MQQLGSQHPSAGWGTARNKSISTPTLEPCSKSHPFCFVPTQSQRKGFPGLLDAEQMMQLIVRHFCHGCGKVLRLRAGVPPRLSLLPFFRHLRDVSCLSLAFSPLTLITAFMFFPSLNLLLFFYNRFITDSVSTASAVGWCSTQPPLRVPLC